MLHPEAPDLAGAHSGMAATDGSAGAGWIAGFGGVPATRRAYRREDDSRIAGGGEAKRAAPLREDRRDGLQAARPAGEARRVPDQDTPAAPTEGTRAAPKRGRADSTGAGASASANASDIAGGWLACGPHNAGCMQTCEQTGGENGTGHVDNGTTHDTDTVKGMTWPPIVMPSASLV